IAQRQHRGVFRSLVDVNELRGLLAQTNRNSIEDDQIRAAIANGLPDLFARKRLQLFGLAADQDDCLCMSNVAMSCQLTAEILKEGRETKSIINGEVISLDDLTRELPQSVERFICKPWTSDYGNRFASVFDNNLVKPLGRKANRF